MLLEPVLVFVLVLTRISALVMTAPTIGAQAAPPQIRAFVALSLALLITPVQLAFAPPLPANLLELVSLLLCELLLGLTLGLALLILVAGLQLAGYLIGNLSGMQMAELFDPSYDMSSPVVGKLLELVALAVFFTIGGHRQVIAALLTSFRHVPPGRGGWSEHFVSSLVTTTAHSFEVSVRAAAPVVLALLIATLILALIGRTLPQLNILAVGFSINSFVLFALLTVTITSAAWLFSGEAELAIDSVVESFKAMEASRNGPGLAR